MIDVVSSVLGQQAAELLLRVKRDEELASQRKTWAPLASGRHYIYEIGAVIEAAQRASTGIVDGKSSAHLHQRDAMSAVISGELKVIDQRTGRLALKESVVETGEQFVVSEDALNEWLCDQGAVYRVGAKIDGASTSTRHSAQRARTIGCAAGPAGAMTPDELKVARQTDRLKFCRDEGLKFGPSPHGRLPHGIAKAARKLGITRQSLTEDVKAALAREAAIQVHRIK